MADPTLSEKLAKYNVALQLAQIPPEVIDAAKLHILDSIGCLLAGTRLEVGKLAYELAAHRERRFASVDAFWNRSSGFLSRRCPSDVGSRPLR